MKKPDRNDVLKGTLPALIVVLIGLLLGKAVDLLDWKTISIAVGLCLVILFGTVGLALSIQQASHQEELDGLIQRLEAIIPPSSFDWLLTDADLAIIEGKVTGKEIWIVSPDLHYDLIKKNFQPLTKKNFRKGITYTYIVPKSERMQAQIPTLREVYGDYRSQVKIKQVAEDTFRLLAVTHIDIYDPNGKKGPRVFLELPVKQKGYWIEVDQDAAFALTGRFRGIVEDEGI